MIQPITEQTQEEAKEKSRMIVLQAIQRYAAEQTSDHTVSTVAIPSDDMKGRVIGREGRNIRSFEKATGVDVIIDDTPGMVVVSCFDPVRRQIARISLERLVQDGRIHPARIEEIVAATSKEMDEELIKIGSDAVQEANLPGIAKPIIPMLGRLGYRTSYGQNVLRHSMEVAYLAQVMADELGLDGALARRCGLLHDIGKAMDHEQSKAAIRRSAWNSSASSTRAKRFSMPPSPTTATFPRRRPIRRSSWPPTRSAPAGPVLAARVSSVTSTVSANWRTWPRASKASARPTRFRPAAKCA